MRYLTAWQAKQINGLSNKEKRRISKRLKKVVKNGSNYAIFEKTNDKSTQYIQELITWLTDLGYYCKHDEYTHTIYIYWNLI